MKKIVMLFAIVTLFFSGCDQLMETLNMINCKYKIDQLANVSWAGIDLTNIQSFEDLSVSDLAKAGLAISQNDYNVNFDMNILALNETETAAKISGFDYILLLNDSEITNGEYDTELTIEPNGGTGILPISMNIDAQNIVSGGTVEDVVNMVLNMVNYGNGESSDVAVKFSPWIPVGNTIQKMPYITLSHTLQ